MIRRVLLSCAVLFAPAAHAQWSIEQRNAVGLPSSAVDQNGQPFTVTGLSGITYAGGTRWICVLDNSDKLLELDVTLDPNGSIQAATVTAGFTIAETRDFEGVAFAGGTPGSVLLAEEGSPAVHEYALLDGALLQSLRVPTVFANRRPNLGFESMARACPAGDLWTANEEALTVDGMRASPSQGTTVRLLRYAGGTAAEQFAYEVESMHGPYFPGPNGQSGLSELVTLPGGGLLAVERSLAFTSPFFLTRMYEIDFAGATDVSTFPALDGANYTPVGKELLWSGGASNLEGLAVGPTLTGGERALLGVVDDGDPLSQNQLVAFELVGPPFRDAATAANCR